MKIKTKNGKIIIKNDKISCECCGVFYGFDVSIFPRTKYKKMTLHDMDCCSVCGVPPDGTMTMLAINVDVGIVISATGNFAPDGCSPRIGQIYGKETFGVADGDSGTVFSDIKKNTNIINSHCCNPTGDLIWCELSEPIL